MTLFQSILLGIVQGLTEFLPISSSAHLVFTPYLFGWDIPEHQAFIFNVLVQDATLLAVIVYFWRDLWGIALAFLKALPGWIRSTPLRREMGIKAGGAQPAGQPAPFQARLGWYLILASIPAGIFGLLVKDQVEAAFGSPRLTAVFLIVTAGLLLLAEFLGKRIRSFEQISVRNALWMGVFQALSIFPGISRSGSTITGGMISGLQRAAAARFSFMMSVPIMLAAGLLASLDLLELPDLATTITMFIPGLIAAAVVGYLSIHWLLKVLTRQSLRGFAVYCAAIGLGFLILTFIVPV